MGLAGHFLCIFNFFILINSSAGFSREAKGLWPEECLPTPSCKYSEVYRSLDGSCNNLEHPAWGMAKTPLVRVLKARYEDDVYEMPKARSGHPLPLARALRTFLFPDKEVDSEVLSLAVMSWGQLIIHDASRISSRGGEECCSKKRRLLPREDTPDNCLVIEVPRDDEFYSHYNITCIGMTRSVTAERCSRTGPIHQMSAQSHFIDGSMVYGVNKEESWELRTGKGGELKVQTSSAGYEYLPDDPELVCGDDHEEEKCYKAGDDRVNQQPPLTVLHTLLLREHNRLCRELCALNPHWSDEKLFQEARRILIAQVQHITYTQYLPVLLGNIAKEKFGSTKFGYGKGYSSSLNPGTLNSFTTAAFRGFHSLIPHHIGSRKDDPKCPFFYTRLKAAINKPKLIQNGDRFDDFLRGLVQQPSQEMDPYFTEQTSNVLFNDNKDFGIDLEALDILRGRDHGIPTYNTFRKACGLKKVQLFSSLSDVMPKAAWTALSDIYQDVEDIDLYVGGLLETKLPGSLVGPTFKCILMEQFTRWKYGDRFFYDFGGYPGSFDLDQLHEIRKTSLSALICSNGNDISRIQKDAFKQVSNRNEQVPCKKIKRMNLKPWKDLKNW